MLALVLEMLNIPVDENGKQVVPPFLSLSSDREGVCNWLRRRPVTVPFSLAAKPKLARHR
jgi:hypothetical protein